MRPLLLQGARKAAYKGGPRIFGTCFRTDPASAINSPLVVVEPNEV